MTPGLLVWVTGSMSVPIREIKKLAAVFSLGQVELEEMVGGHLGREMMPKVENFRTQGEVLSWV